MAGTVKAMRAKNDKTTRILVVESDRYARNFLNQLLGEFGTVKFVEAGPQIFEAAKKFKPGLVFISLDDTELNGLCLCRWLKKHRSDVCIVLMTSADSNLDLVREFRAVANAHVKTPFDPREVKSLLCQLLETQMRTANKRDESNPMDTVLTKFAIASEYASAIPAGEHALLPALTTIAELKDQGGLHLARVQGYARLIAKRLKASSRYASLITDEFEWDLEYASRLHDVGNVAISDTLLCRTGELSEVEFEAIKLHTILGADMLETLSARFPASSTLQMACRIARSHHENWDGSGYPERLIGEQIPLEARIVAVADVFDALTSHRKFRDSFTPELARNVIANESEKQFDPVVVNAFLEILDDICLLRESINASEQQSGTSLPTRNSAESHDESILDDEFPMSETTLNQGNMPEVVGQFNAVIS